MQVCHVLVAAALTATTYIGVPVSEAAPSSCSDVEVVFARGTGEAPGLGWMGEAFVSAMRSELGSRTLSSYAVNYPATQEWSTGVQGIADAKNRVMDTASRCPDTCLVLSGFSQGAAVMGFVTSDTVPAGIDPSEVPAPMSADIADHVAAVVLFGTPNERAMGFLGQPSITIGAPYLNKALLLCADEDPVCSEGMNFSAHNSYVDNGMVVAGARFAAHRWE